VGRAAPLEQVCQRVRSLHRFFIRRAHFSLLFLNLLLMLLKPVGVDLRGADWNPERHHHLLVVLQSQVVGCRALDGSRQAGHVLSARLQRSQHVSSRCQILQ